MQATGFILLLAASILVLFGEGGSFVPAQKLEKPHVTINLIAKDAPDPEM
ncbi:MAG: hypothetical protein AAGG69_11950 [Pseudomonadota bacterium]